jgi:hypothetical protein
MGHDPSVASGVATPYSDPRQMKQRQNHKPQKKHRSFGNMDLHVVAPSPALSAPGTWMPTNARMSPSTWMHTSSSEHLY